MCNFLYCLEVYEEKPSIDRLSFYQCVDRLPLNEDAMKLTDSFNQLLEDDFANIENDIPELCIELENARSKADPQSVESEEYKRAIYCFAKLFYLSKENGYC